MDSENAVAAHTENAPGAASQDKTSSGDSKAIPHTKDTLAEAQKADDAGEVQVVFQNSSEEEAKVGGDPGDDEGPEDVEYDDDDWDERLVVIGQRCILALILIPACGLRRTRRLANAQVTGPRQPSASASIQRKRPRSPSMCCLTCLWVYSIGSGWLFTSSP